MLISKTTFLEYLYCPKNTWLKLHKPELLERFTLSEFELNLVEQGNEVEAYARNLFPGGVQVVTSGDEACRETTRLMASRVPAIFQATFVIDGFIAKADVLAWNKDKECWDLYEIKGTNSLKEDARERDHVDDVVFQTSVLRRAGVKAGSQYVIHLNKEYIRFGDLDIEKLFIKEDITEKAGRKLQEIEGLMEQAKKDLIRTDEPEGGCECHYESRGNHCTTFAYSHPEVPEYGMHDLVRIGNSKKKLVLMVDNEWYRLEDIPEDFELTDNQRHQIRAHLSGKPHVSEDAAREELSKLNFPLYFLDYETYAPAIPMFDGYHPYQRIPFQFSLHILRSPDAKLEQFEFLKVSAEDPSEEIAKLLEQHIEPKGTVIVWFQTFEKGVHKEIGERLTQYRPLMERINSQVYDLMEIFSKRHYVHPGFRGSASIKKVLPVIAPELTYEDLSIREGMQASNSWWEMITSGTSQARKGEIEKGLKEYCGRDTYAMYVIWDHLRKMFDA